MLFCCSQLLARCHCLFCWFRVRLMQPIKTISCAADESSSSIIVSNHEKILFYIILQKDLWIERIAMSQISKVAGIFADRIWNAEMNVEVFSPDRLPFSCFLRWRSRLVCWPKQRSHKWHLKGFSLLWMLRMWRCRLEEMLNERSQYLHLQETWRPFT